MDINTYDLWNQVVGLNCQLLLTTWLRWVYPLKIRLFTVSCRSFVHSFIPFIHLNNMGDVCSSTEWYHRDQLSKHGRSVKSCMFFIDCIECRWLHLNMIRINVNLLPCFCCQPSHKQKIACSYICKNCGCWVYLSQACMQILWNLRFVIVRIFIKGYTPLGCSLYPHALWYSTVIAVTMVTNTGMFSYSARNCADVHSQLVSGLCIHGCPLY